MYHIQYLGLSLYYVLQIKIYCTYMSIRVLLLYNTGMLTTLI